MNKVQKAISQTTLALVFSLIALAQVSAQAQEQQKSQLSIITLVGKCQDYGNDGIMVNGNEPYGDITPLIVDPATLSDHFTNSAYEAKDGKLSVEINKDKSGSRAMVFVNYSPNNAKTRGQEVALEVGKGQKYKVHAGRCSTAIDVGSYVITTIVDWK